MRPWQRACWARDRFVMIESPRLFLRPWQDADRAPFHAMCADPRVMATIGPVLSRADSDAWVDRHVAYQAALGHCFWVSRRREDGAFLGICGLKPGLDGSPIDGEIEIGWRLAHAHWGKGYAKEAANAVLAWAWAQGIGSVAAITAAANRPSWGLMERLGFVRAPQDDFDHPLALPHLRAHVTYRIVPAL